MDRTNENTFSIIIDFDEDWLSTALEKVKSGERVAIGLHVSHNENDKDVCYSSSATLEGLYRFGIPGYRPVS